MKNLILNSLNMFFLSIQLFAGVVFAQTNLNMVPDEDTPEYCQKNPAIFKDKAGNPKKTALISLIEVNGQLQIQGVELFEGVLRALNQDRTPVAGEWVIEVLDSNQKVIAQNTISDPKSDNIETFSKGKRERIIKKSDRLQTGFSVRVGLHPKNWRVNRHSFMPA